MFNIGFGEMVIIGIIALIVIGPKELPKMARTVGRMMNEFKRATGDISAQFLELKDSAHKEFQTHRDEIKKVVDLETLARSANQSKDEFIAQLKRELDTLEKTKEANHSINESLSESHGHQFFNGNQKDLLSTHPLARDDFESLSTDPNEQPTLFDHTANAAEQTSSVSSATTKLRVEEILSRPLDATSHQSLTGHSKVEKGDQA